MTALLDADGLELAYGELTACRDISITVGAGEIVTLIGSNGAGKTTILRAIAGALPPRAGVIRFDGREITRLPAYDRTQLGIALVPEGRHVFPFQRYARIWNSAASNTAKTSPKSAGSSKPCLTCFHRFVAGLARLPER